MPCDSQNLNKLNLIWVKVDKACIDAILSPIYSLECLKAQSKGFNPTSFKIHLVRGPVCIGTF